MTELVVTNKYICGLLNCNNKSGNEKSIKVMK